MLLSGKHLFEPQAYVMERAPDGSSHRFRLEFQSVREEFSWSGGLDGYTYSFNGRTYQDVESLWKEPE